MIKNIKNDYLVLDIETTGLKAEESAKITEIACAKFYEDVCIKTFSSLVFVVDPVPEFITKLTGIDSNMLKHAPTLVFVFDEIMSFFGINENTNIVVHNKSFDIPFIEYCLKDYKEYLEEFKAANFICSLEMARNLLPGQSHKLDVLTEQFGYKGKSHRALNDVLKTGKVYWELCKIAKNNISNK
jgi:DNA polymerase III epsilon subunit family exonuclease